ncbi:o-succinylbenzoate--CoA ligase [Bacillus sp. AGMB 02131]|uniref:2-succinylbenzoate--CoA ligase n=1 Tax=Peribacillus faecalis TaxID=2772559 RepID=A0A927D0P4_9BACI|nr:o-succinylbenzoate--CoA ligase [Peribacillus faecalis]MBD3110554.1 o-succinylbenzoate--CoA ligase [Peribacillus faecalis]
MEQNNNMPNWLKKRAQLSPQRTAIIYEEKQYSFQELYELVMKLSRKLHKLGVRSNERIGLLMNTKFEMVTAIHASMQLGAELVLFNSRLTNQELLWQFEDSQLDWLITEEHFKGIVDSRFSPVFIEEMESVKESDSFEEAEEFHLHRTATIMYTSGTSGYPKAVRQTYGNHWWSAVGSMLNLGLHENDRWLCTMPLFHISGLSILMRSIVYGMTVILHKQFDEKLVNEDIRRYEVTIMSVVTSMLNRMLVQLGDNNYPASLRCLLLGGGPAPLSILESCKNKKIPVFQTYGMTETSSQIVTLSPEYSLEKLGSAGKALFPSQLKIMVDGREAGTREIGEILVKGPNVTVGYVNRQEETSKAFLDGWLKTGDIGYLDEDGFLYVVDRRSDLIISGGENIYPAEIEAALLKHPSVFEAGVTGAEDAKWGQVPVAFVVVNDLADPDELLNHCRQYLAGYKVPKQLHFVSELPRNASNKLLRRQLLKLIEQ